MQREWQELRDQTTAFTKSERASHDSNSGKDPDFIGDDSLVVRERLLFRLDHKLNGTRPYWQLPDSSACGGPESGAFSQLREGISSHETPCDRSEMSKWSRQIGYEALNSVLSQEYK